MTLAMSVKLHPGQIFPQEGEQRPGRRVGVTDQPRNGGLLFVDTLPQRLYHAVLAVEGILCGGLAALGFPKILFGFGE